MRDYILLVNPVWWKDVSNKMLLSNIPNSNYIGIPVVEDKNVGTYILCIKEGNSYVPARKGDIK